MALIVHEGQLQIDDYPELPPEVRGRIVEMLSGIGLSSQKFEQADGSLVLPQFVEHSAGRTNLAPFLGRLLGYVDPRKAVKRREFQTALRTRRYPIQLDFVGIDRHARAFAADIETKFETLAKVLLRHESYEVVQDETARTLELLRSLSENAPYFRRQIGSIATFLPRNQPLYALACFGIVPALMATDVHVKPPSSMAELFHELWECLSIHQHFPNLRPSSLDRSSFVKERAAIDPQSRLPVTDAVIFTGTMRNADRLRSQFPQSTLFIANGAGHNPIVIADDAEVDRAVESVLRVQLYNSGQDCASPNAILVHSAVYDCFVRRLRHRVAEVKVGNYEDRSNRVGPFSDRKGLSDVLNAFLENARYLDTTTPGIVHGRSGIIEPTIILRPLVESGNFTEFFAPIFFVQRYEKDEGLSFYFDDPRYTPNAMYVTLFGTSPFVESLLTRVQSDGRPLHDRSTIIRNTDLHAPGIERGTQPYGGYGRGASCVSLNGVIEPKPTLPQRDLYEYLVRPTLNKE